MPSSDSYAAVAGTAALPAAALRVAQLWGDRAALTKLPPTRQVDLTGSILAFQLSQWTIYKGAQDGLQSRRWLLL